MTTTNNGMQLKASRFELATMAQHLLLDVLPFRYPDSLQGLEAFVDRLWRCRSMVADLDVVLLRCLATLNRHTGERLPSLIEIYVSDEPNAGKWARFSRIVENAFRYQGIVDERVEKAIAVITAEYGNHRLSPPFSARPATDFVHRFQRTGGSHIVPIHSRRAARSSSSSIGDDEQDRKRGVDNLGYSQASTKNL